MTVRIMAPDGTLGQVPEEALPAVLEAGGRVMTPEDMREMYQGVFMAHILFKDKNKPPMPRQRKSLVLRKGQR